MNFSVMKNAMWWVALKKAEEYSRRLEDYLEEQVSDITAHRRTPLNPDIWAAEGDEDGC